MISPVNLSPPISQMNSGAKTCGLAAIVLFFHLPASIFGSAAPNSLDLNFPAGTENEWTVSRKVPGKPTLVFEKSGLEFQSEGFDLLTREWPIGTAPFEVSADITMTKGRTEAFNRARGLVITLSTVPVLEMGPTDTAIILAVTQTGVILTAKSGGARIGAERRPGVWYFPGQDVGGAFTTSMAGQGGQVFSVRWPTKMIAGTQLRLWASRDALGSIHLKLYNADGASAPWWEAGIPDRFAVTDFRWLTIHPGREAADFQDLSRFSLADGQGNGPADGILTRLQLRALDGTKTQLDQPFPAAILRSERPARSLLVSQENLEKLRARFNSPAFSNYKTVLLRTAAPETISALKMGQPNQSEAVFALTWALLLTNDTEKYRQPLLAQIDALIGTTDLYPSEKMEFPGHLRQNLFIREFWVQNLAALALAYDLAGNHLGEDRRDRIRFLLVRMLKSYHALLDDGDWWFGGNPSNTIGVGNGCVGLVAVALREEDPELADKTIQRVLENIRKLFVGVDPDGGCIEGVMYWNYGLGYPMLLGWVLRETTGNDEGLLSSPQVKNATRYLAVNFGGDDKMIPFNDTQPWLIGWPVLAAAGTEADSLLARWMADHMAAEYATGNPAPEQARSTYTIPAFLYRDTVPAPEEFPGLPNVAVLESVQEGVMRSDGKELTPLMVTGVKGKGPLSTHHGNEDQGSFVFYVNGEMILLDPGYFEETAQKHSLPMIGDAEKMTLSAITPALLSDIWEEGNRRSITVDATDAYNLSKKSPPVAKRARRVFVQLGDKALVILDDTLPRDSNLRVTAQYQAGVPVDTATTSATLRGKSENVRLDLFGPPLQITSLPREFAKNWIYKRRGIPWTTLRAEYTADANRPLITVLRRESAVKETPTVQFESGKITVRLAGEKPVTFIKSNDIWTAEKP